MKYTIVVEVEADPTKGLPQYLGCNAVADLIIEGVAVDKVSVRDANGDLVFDEQYTPETRQQVIAMAKAIGKY